jgi:hypothetical protein
LFYFIFSVLNTDIGNLQETNVKDNNKLEKMKEENENEIKDLEKIIEKINGKIEAKQKEFNGNNDFFRFFERYKRQKYRLPPFFALKTPNIFKSEKWYRKTKVVFIGGGLDLP